MSTDHMPTPPDALTNQASDKKVRGQTIPSTQAATEQAAVQAEHEGGPLNEDMARLLEEQVGVIAQQMVYHSQMMYGVGGLGTDPVSARQATLEIAGALRSRTKTVGMYALVNLGDPQIAQANDRTMPFKFNSQVAGLFEGILLDTFSKAYRDDEDRREEARKLLMSIFLPANEELQSHEKVIPMMSQAPAMGDSFKLLDGMQMGTQAEAQVNR